LARIEFFAAEPLQEFLGIGGIGEAVDLPPLSIVYDGMAARTDRQALQKS
jgi:hypothetical protein